MSGHYLRGRYVPPRRINKRIILQKLFRNKFELRATISRKCPKQHQAWHDEAVSDVSELSVGN